MLYRSSRISRAIAVVGLVLFVGCASNAAEKKAKKKPEANNKGRTGLNILKVETIEKKLGKDLALKPDQKKKVEAAREEIAKKWEEIKAKPDYAAAKEAVKKAQAKAKEAKDAEAKKAARKEVAAANKKVKEIMGGFSAVADFKKALAGILSEKQMAKLYPPRKKKEAAKGKKKPEKEGG